MGPADRQPPSRGATTIPFGPFVLERRLAVGGSAEVFVARPRIGTVPVPQLVVKRLLPGARSGSDFDALEREAELHRAVSHPNVVRVFGAGVVGTEPYLAMEYVEGVDLYRMLRRAEAEQRPIPTALVTYIARQVASALSAVHGACDASGASLEIVHRDVTPSNIYLSLRGAVKLGDFGIANIKQRPSGTEPPGGLKGKFGYLAPEQIAGEPYGHRADLFSLAAVLGEMLIGQRIFPGSGQLAVLLAIRDVNIEPLLERRDRLPPGMLEVLQTALARDPAARFEDAGSFARELERFTNRPDAELVQELSEWVEWSRDASQFARRIEGQIRDSVQHIQSVRKSSGQFAAAPTSRTGPGSTRQSPKSARGDTSRVRCRDGRVIESVAFPRLVEMIATGELQTEDEVALMGAEFRKIRDISEIARHLLPSTTATTGRLFEPGAPDYQVRLQETSMLEVLARLRASHETGGLFIEQRESDGTPHRKELYVGEGRLIHVASSDRAELLGEYLVRRGAITRAQLEHALGLLARRGSHLGDTLIALGWVDAMEVFRAIRDQGRDRVAALCSWSRGTVTFYRDTLPSRNEFPLDLDLASPMMAGALVLARGDARTLLPAGNTRLAPGPRFAATAQRSERGTAPVSLQLLIGLIEEGVTLEDAIDRLTALRSNVDLRRSSARSISENEACAALHTAKVLGWVRF